MTSFFASLLLPGSSQLLHDQSRGYLYGALELAGWLGFAHGRHQGSQYRDDYRDLAWREARVDASGDRVVGDFRYYEAVGEFVSSGAWDADPDATGLQPETDPETYNGMIWELARELHLSGAEDPDSVATRRALQYYQERSYPPEMAWNWGGSTPQMTRYRELIDKSDDGFRRATVILGAVVANHLVSAVDGLLSTRVAARSRVDYVRPVGPPGAVRAMPAPRWTLVFSVGLSP